MKKFRVTLLVPQTRVIEAHDLQEAHNYVTKMMENQPDREENPATKVHSIIEVEEPQVIDFGMLPTE